MDKYEMRRSALQELIDSLGWGGISKVAKRIEKTPSYVSRMLLPPTKPNFKRIGEDTADLITAAFPHWLDQYQSPGGRFANWQNMQLGMRLPTIPAHRVPVVGTASLGDDGYWAEMDYPVGAGDGMVQFDSNDANAYAIRCRGASMMPRIRDGEFVVVEPNRTPIPGDDVLVKHIDGRVMVKRFLYERDGMIHLLSINEAFPPHAFPRDQIEVFHPVGGIAMRSMWVPE
jgi:phage repressor protein C with HTH and peptisase S24 domain